MQRLQLAVQLADGRLQEATNAYRGEVSDGGARAHSVMAGGKGPWKRWRSQVYGRASVYGRTSEQSVHVRGQWAAQIKVT